jgi:hypothetical protein
MHEFTRHLERIFKAKVLYMSVDQRSRPETIPSIYGSVYSHVAPPSMTVRINLAYYDDKRPIVENYLHVFRPITQSAVVTNVRHEVHALAKYGGPTSPSMYTVEFVVHDYERFAEDLEKYSWEDFSEEFNGQLDKVLGEE